MIYWPLNRASLRLLAFVLLRSFDLSPENRRSTIDLINQFSERSVYQHFFQIHRKSIEYDVHYKGPLCNPRFRSNCVYIRLQLLPAIISFWPSLYTRGRDKNRVGNPDSRQPGVSTTTCSGISAASSIFASSPSGLGSSRVLERRKEEERMKKMLA